MVCPQRGSVKATAFRPVFDPLSTRFGTRRWHGPVQGPPHSPRAHTPPRRTRFDACDAKANELRLLCAFLLEALLCCARILAHDQQSRWHKQCDLAACFAMATNAWVEGYLDALVRACGCAASVMAIRRLMTHRTAAKMRAGEPAGEPIHGAHRVDADRNVYAKFYVCTPQQLRWGKGKGCKPAPPLCRCLSVRSLHRIAHDRGLCSRDLSRCAGATSPQLR